VNLRLRRIEHVGIHFANHVKYHSSNWDKNNEQPAHGPGSKRMVRDHCKGRELACPESTNELVNSYKENIKANGHGNDSIPRIRHTAEESFSHVFAARKCRPAPMNKRSRLEKNLVGTKRQETERWKERDREVNQQFSYNQLNWNIPGAALTLYARRMIMHVNVTVPTLFKSPPSPSPGESLLSFLMRPSNADVNPPPYEC
jgi:hypothetical protein